MTKYRILVVDDVEDIRLLVGDYLVDQGFAIDSAGSGRVAARMAEDNDYDLVLTDIRMNDGDGIELLETLRSRDPLHPPVYIMTAYADFGGAEALARGASELLKKPLDLGELSASLRRELQERQAPFTQKIAGQHNIMLRYKSRTISDELETLQWGNAGCFVAGLTTLVPDSLAEFSLYFEEEDDTWTGCARVRWARSRGHQRFLAGYGLQFVRLDGDMREWFLEKRNQHPTAEIIPVGFSKNPL